MWFTANASMRYHVPACPKSTIPANRVDRETCTVYTYEFEIEDVGKLTYYRVRDLATDEQIASRATISAFKRLLEADIAIYEGMQKAANGFYVGGNDIDTVSAIGHAAIHHIAREDLERARMAVRIIDEGIFTALHFGYPLGQHALHSNEYLDKEEEESHIVG